MRSTFTALDAVVLVAYLAGTTALGMWVGRRQKDAKDYFVADRAIPWWAVMFSVVATETSALTFISTPGLAYGTPALPGNLGFLQIVAGYVIGRFVVAYVLLPRYYEGELVTAYALLERRFGLATRRFTSIVFMVTRAMADSVRVFPTAIPIELIISPTVEHKALIVQRLLSSRSLRDGQRAIIGSGFVVFAQFTLFLFIGLGLWAFYHGRPFTPPDSMFPSFIIDYMPSGLV